MAPLGRLTNTGRLLSSKSSTGTEPRDDARTTPRTSDGSSTLVLSRSLMSAANTPTIRPSTTPTAKYRTVFGDDLVNGVCAFCTIETFTGDVSPVYKSFSITVFSDSATALAMSAACFGSPSTAAIFTKAVLVGLVTVIWPARSSTVSSKPSSLMTGLSTFSVAANVGYEVIWLEIYVPPVDCWLMLSPSWEAL